MPRHIFVALAILGLSACASARGPELVLPSLEHFKSQATETVDIELGPLRLAFARWMLGEHDPDTVAFRNTLKACKAVRIRSYEFASDFAYPRADVEAIRSQLSGHGWSQLATVRDRKADEDVDVYIALDKERVTGLIVVASEPREFTIVNVAGPLDTGQIESLRARFSAHIGHKSMPDGSPSG